MPDTKHIIINGNLLTRRQSKKRRPFWWTPDAYCVSNKYSVSFLGVFWIAFRIAFDSAFGLSLRSVEKFDNKLIDKRSSPCRCLKWEEIVFIFKFRAVCNTRIITKKWLWHRTNNETCVYFEPVSNPVQS